MSSSNSFVFCLFLLKLVINPGVTAAVRFTTDGQPSNVTVLQGDSVHVHCRVTGLLRENKYFIIWLFNNGYIRTDKVRRNIVSRFTSESRDRSELTAVSSFNITHTENADQGFYRCALYENNNPVLTSKQGFVRVISRPKFRRQPSNQTVVEGQNVTLSCTLENYDVAHYVKWFRRGKIIADYSIHETNKSHPGDLSSQEVSGSGTFDLHMNNISREISGKFQCKVFARGYGKSILQSNTAKITVRYPPQMLYPQCNSSNINNVYVQDDVIEATCWAKGGNAPVYFEWMKVGTINNGTLEEFGKLYIGKMRWNLTVHDNGEYISCNMKGFAILNDRQCIIGPLKVQSSRVSTFVSTDGYLPTVESSATFSVSKGSLMSLPPADNLGSRIVYATIVLAAILIAVVIGIVVLYLDLRKIDTEQSTVEASIDEGNPDTNRAPTDPTEDVRDEGQEKREESV